MNLPLKSSTLIGAIFLVEHTRGSFDFGSVALCVVTINALDVHPSQQAQQHAAEKNGQSVSGDPHGPSPLSECEQAFCPLAAEESSTPTSAAKDSL